MEQFTIKIADVPIGIRARLTATRELCRNFLTEEEACAEIILTEQDVERAREAHIQTDIYERRTPGEYSESLLENTALHLRVLDELISHGVVLFHGCAIAVSGKVYVFCADSGTGKTTHARLWLKNISGCYILNGDKPVLFFRDGNVHVCGTPWCGKEHYGTDEILPLAGICLLERDTKNHIERVSFKDNFSALWGHSHRPGGSAELLAYMKLMQKLVSVPIFRLGCNMEDEAAFVSYNAMVSQ